MAEPKVPLLPCPFCGNTELYAGHAESLAMEVACFYTTPGGRKMKGCGARVRVAKPDKWPKEMPDLRSHEVLDWVAQWTLDEAVRRWNTRQEGPTVPRRE